MKLNEQTEFEIFRNNIACRREINQHKARKYWEKIKSQIPENVAKEFERDWYHYKTNCLYTGEFCVICVNPLEKYLINHENS